MLAGIICVALIAFATGEVYHGAFFVMNSKTIGLTIGVFLAVSNANAQSFNLDFGNHDSSPNSLYEGAAHVSGMWNCINSGTAILSNLDGTQSGVTLALSESCTAGYTTDSVESASPLLDDFFYADPAWTVSFSGLSNGSYSLYYYSPNGQTVKTGKFSIQGNPISAELLGNSEILNPSLVEGTSYGVVANILVTDGNLLLSFDRQNGGITSSKSGYTGLAGLQLVKTPAVPESSSFAFFGGVGALALAFLRNRFRKV
jgi:hypothetical protein